MLRPLLIVLAVVIVFAVTLKVTGVLDSEPLDPMSEVVELSFRVQERLEELREERDIAGLTAAFVLPDGRTGQLAVGTVDPPVDGEPDVPLPPEARMLAGSVGKMFVTGVVLDLVGRGVLDLDAPLADHLGDEPWFARIPNAPDLTLRLLMTHSAGVPDHLDTDEWLEEVRAMVAPGADPDRVLTPLESLRYIFDADPLWPAGQDFQYTDSNYLLVGLTVEAATGRGYYELLIERILEPLQLTGTSPQDRRELPGLTPGHMQADNPFGLPERTHGDDGLINHNPALEYCGGGVVSTPHDLSRYAWMLYRGMILDWDYRPDLLDGATLPESDRWRPGRYGLSTFMHRGDLGPTLGHTGWYPGYTTAVTYFVDHDIAVAVQANRDWDTDIAMLADELAKVVVD